MEQPEAENTSKTRGAHSPPAPSVLRSETERDASNRNPLSKGEMPPRGRPRKIGDAPCSSAQGAELDISASLLEENFRFTGGFPSPSSAISFSSLPRECAVSFDEAPFPPGALGAQDPPQGLFPGFGLESVPPHHAYEEEIKFYNSCFGIDGGAEEPLLGGGPHDAPPPPSFQFPGRAPALDDAPLLPPEGPREEGGKAFEDSSPPGGGRFPPHERTSWFTRRKRRTNPLLLQYIQSNREVYPGVVHPSRYSSVDFVQGMDTSQKMYLGTLRKQPVVVERSNTNTVLPLYLNSTTNFNNSTHYKEFISVSGNFMRRVGEIDFDNVTVQQLKGVMREFGLNHTGKKNELIERLKQTVGKISGKYEILQGKQISFEEAPKASSAGRDGGAHGNPAADETDMNFLFL